MAEVQNTVQAVQETFFYDQDELEGFLQQVREIIPDYDVSWNPEKSERLLDFLRQTLGKGVPEKRGVA